METVVTEIQSPNQNPNRNLNDLPDDLLLRILAFIPTPDAVRASLISRRWLSLWSHLPCLHFSYDLFHLAANADMMEPQPLSDTSHRLASLIDRVFIFRPNSPPITSFRLSFIFFHYYTSHIDSWIRASLTRFHARELHLDFRVDRLYHISRDSNPAAAAISAEPAPDVRYEFPLSFLRDSSVETLSLTHAALVLPLSFCFPSIRAMYLDSIRAMYLDHVNSADDDDETMLERLIQGCPNLEELELQNGGLVPNIRIHSKSIKRLTFGYYYDCYNMNTLEIDCPNLVSLSFDCVSFTHFRLKNVSSLVEYDFRMVHHVQFYDIWCKNAKLLAFMPNLKRLKMQNWCFKLLTSTDSFPKNFMLRNLNLLELQTGSTQHDLVGVAALLEFFPKLERLILGHLYKIEVDESLPEEIANKPVSFNIPTLKEVKMLDCFGSEDESKFLTLLKQHGVPFEQTSPSETDGELPPISSVSSA